jgi:PAS domain S-box-containing protein
LIQIKPTFAAFFNEFSYLNYYLGKIFKVSAGNMSFVENNNITRLEMLESYNLMDSSQEKLYDDITKFAASICKTPISLLTLLDDKSTFLKSNYGFKFEENSLKDSICRNIIKDNIEFLLLENIDSYEEYKKYFISKPFSDIKFYAGVSLTTSNGHKLGTLCIMDYVPRTLTNLQLKTLNNLAKQVIQLFELRKAKKEHLKNREQIKNNTLLLQKNINIKRVGTWEWYLKDDNLKLNPQAIKILGYPLNEELTKFNRELWNNHIHPLDLPMVNENLKKHIDQESDFYNAQYRMFDTNGQLLWVQERGKILNWDSNNEPKHLFGTITDITKKVHYDSEVERLKNNQETLINATSDLTWSVDTEFKLIIANSAFIEIMKKQIGYTLKEGDSIFSKNLNSIEKKKWISYYQRALEGERFSVKEEINPTEQKAITYGLISFNPIYNNKNSLIGVGCYSKDITSEVISQQITLKAKIKMEKILDTSMDIICTVDEEFRISSINKAGHKILGYPTKEIIGKKFIDFVVEEDREISIEISKSIILGRNVKNFENRYLHKDGHLVSMLWSGNWNNEDKVMYCIGRDITEKKIKELQLEQSERRFKTLVQEGSDLVAILDENATYTYVSPNSTKILQISPQEFIGTNAFDYIHPDDKEYTYSQLSKILKESQIAIKPFRFKNRDNEWRWIETIATNQLHEPALNGIVTNSRDVTDRVLRIQSIEEQNRKLKNIAWNQSHVVRAPVARLLGLVGLLQEEGCLKKIEKEKILKYILESAEEIDHVIKQTIEQTATEKKVIDKK